MLIRNKKVVRVITVFVLVQFVFQIFYPTVGYALTSGPSQPEFSSFEPVSTTTMVDEFSGDFTYNLPVLEVPGPHGSGYPLSLSYHSGVTPEEEASWVGYGWTLNAGAINRNVRGVPDDFKGKKMIYNNKMPTNWTATVGAGISFGELFSKDISLGFNTSVRYNNYRGFGYNTGIQLGKGFVSLGYNTSQTGEGSFSLGISPAAILNGYLDNHRLFQRSTHYKLNDKVDQAIKLRASGSISLIGSNYGLFSYNENTKPTVINHYEGLSYNVSFGLQINPSPFPVGTTENAFGSFSFQTNADKETPDAYGYLYSSSSNEESVMDYHVEKETDYNKRDVFLGMPFNDPDNFIATGEGIGGGFRLYAKNVGHFGPKKMTSQMKILNQGGDVSIGPAFGGGIDLGVGSNSLEVGDWNRTLTQFSNPNNLDDDEPFLFRFNNDLGGEWGSAREDKAEQASVFDRSLSVKDGGIMNKNGARSGRSSYIGYNTNSQMMNGTAPSERSFNHNNYINVLSARGSSDQDLVGEISVSNESGANHLYALPVYNRKEKSLSSSVAGANPTDIKGNFLIYNTQKADIALVGEEQDASYASTYLLTEITSPDYLDLSNDGPTVDDRGGYTRFNYYKQTTTDWYNWRMPYSGLLYNKNSQSDPKDDLGSYTQGEKEIYYLKSIETKTHIAFFELETRTDAKEAPITDALAQTPNPGPVALQRLKTIKLYSLEDCKNTDGQVERNDNPNSPDYGTPVLQNEDTPPLKTVYFKYNYSLCTNLPNSTSGKNTLTSVFFEYNGISKTRLSPYVFYYNYDFSSYPSKYTSGPDDVTSGYTKLLTTPGTSSPENPGYSIFLNDAWGNYQANGEKRFRAMENWVDQDPDSDPTNKVFDPAAWNLKRIQLPSGGQIHVQYEQDDYNYVQDQEAHVMMNIKSIDNTGSHVTLDSNTAGYANDPGDVNLTATRDMIIKRYIQGGRKMYFKILYTLIGNNLPDLETCNADFITGYASVVGCNIATNGDLVVDLRLNDRVPVHVCKDFVKTQRLGMIDPNGNCVPGMNNTNEPLSIVRQLLSTAKGIVIPSSICNNMNPKYSYLRVPTALPKRGGGLRVKRLMTFDNTVGGQPVLYGNEYFYRTTNDAGRVISSGVATNEPSTIREENILVDFIARKKQNFGSIIVAGKDKKQSEGALGESILPGASVGYSKVTIKNIHSGKTTPGFSVIQFYTAKDFPVILASPDNAMTMTPFAGGTPEKKYIIGVFVNIIKDKTWVSQGFSFILNAMHGQVRSKSTYSGNYPGPAATLAPALLTSEVKYDYFKPGDKIPVMNSLFGRVEDKSPGREVDLTFAQKKIVESSYDANIEGDIDISLFGIFPVFYVTAAPTLNFTEGALYTHATTKVIRYPAILKSTSVFQDGILHTEENIAFDEYSGRPVMTKSLDEFKGAYLAQSVPASWEYDNFKPKALSERKVISASNMSFNSSSGGTEGMLSMANAACEMMGQLTAGDVLVLNGSYYYQVKNIDFIHDRLELVVRGGNVIPGSASITTAMILNSGHNNRLSENVGEIVFHNADEKSLTKSSNTVSESQRWVTSGVNDGDGSLFISDLNRAFQDPTQLPMRGPYFKMNVIQFQEYVPAGCLSDLTQATIKNVHMIFKTENGATSVRIGTFDLDCGSPSWPTIQMPIQ